MPINFNLEDVRTKFNCVNFFETGLWDPRDNVSSKQAIQCNFDKVFCMWLDNYLYFVQGQR